MKFEETIECYKKIKLIIWDLDETFWTGTLSEGKITPSENNINLVRKLTNRGIVNSICSKNNELDVVEKLTELKVDNYFVFKSIDWQTKGLRVKKIIEDMQLRDENVLFIDDNISNLKEVEHYNKGIMVSFPTCIKFLMDNVDLVGKNDFNNERLKQYKTLEKKKKDSNEYVNNLDFLKQCNIIVSILSDCENQIDRLFELTNRTNQLNFTKKKYTKEEFEKIIKDSSQQKFYIQCKDNYGDYGIVGYVRIKDGILEDFLFSCRAMGMGVEQYVYKEIGCPKLEIVPPVSGNVSANEKKPDYINVGNDDKKENNFVKRKVMLKGPCDLEVMASFIKNRDNMDLEFNFMDEKGNQVDYYNHSLNILNSINLSEDRKKILTKDYGFLSEEAYKSSIFNGEYDYICYSLLMDATLGVYKSKKDGCLIPFGLYNKSLTEPNNFSDYLKKSVMTARSNFKEEDLLNFSKEFEKIEYSEKNIVSNLKKIIDLINPKTKIILMLLPELEFKSKDNFMKGKEKIHKIINDEIRKTFSCDNRIVILDVNNYIKNQSDYFDSINHYSKKVYYMLAKDLISICNSDGTMKMSSKLKMIYQNIRRQIYKLIKVKK